MTKLQLSPNEMATLKAAYNCTDEAGLPIMSGEGDVVMVLENFGFARIAGEHSNRLFILPAGRKHVEQSA